MGVLALMSGYALMGCAPTVAQPIAQPELSASVPLGPLTQRWRDHHLAEAAQLDWKNAQKRAGASASQEPTLEDWEMAAMLEEAASIPPENVVPVRMVISGVTEGQPHRASMEEFDYDIEFLDSLRGNI